MTTQFYSLITKYGESVISQAVANNTPVPLKTMAIGDGNGTPTTPSESQTTLINEVYRAEITDLLQDSETPNQVIAELLVPETVGGFTVREVGIYDDQNKLVAVANCPENYKPVLEQGSGKVQYYRIVLRVSSSDAVTLSLNNNIVYATRIEFNQFVNNLGNPDGFKFIGQCDSIAQLRTIEPTNDQQRILVKSYHVGKNLGGGVFYADFADTTTADNAGTVIVTQTGKRWKRIITGNSLKLEDFGAVADGVTDCGAMINTAFEVCAYQYELNAGKGIYLTNQELKAPSGLVLVGAGIDQTTIKAGLSLPAKANLFTNKSNNYATRTGKDRDIQVSNIHFDADWRGRYRIGDDINNQACGVKLSAVAACHFYKVRCSNAPLHCFDVSADQYVDTGNITDTSLSRSDLVVFDDCEAFNPYRDDAFTTHNCGGVEFNNCRAYFDGTISALQASQQGFEADEGSYDIRFNNCIATGFVCGYQSKGHATTMPAKRIKFDHCLAVECGYGFMVSVGTNPTGKAGYLPQSAKLTDCAVENLKANAHVSQPHSLYVYGADGVDVDGFSINGTGKIGITHGAGRVNLENIVFNDLITNEQHGCIHITSNVVAGTITIRNAWSAVPQSAPFIAKTNANTKLMVDNCTLNGNGEHGIYLNRNPRDVVRNCLNNGYTNAVYLSATPIGLKGDVVLDSYNQTWLFGNIGTGDIKAPQGTRLFNPSLGKSWVQKSADLNSPKWLPEIHYDDSSVRLSGLTIGQPESTARNLAVNGSAVVSGGLTVGSANSVSLASNGYAQVQTPVEQDNSNKVATTEWVRKLAELAGQVTENGWTRLPNGLILQWASFNAEHSDTFAYPIAFNKCFKVFATDENTTGGSPNYMTVVNKNNENFQLLKAGGVGLFSMWAVGV